MAKDCKSKEEKKMDMRVKKQAFSKLSKSMGGGVNSLSPLS
jgi:hypothetical protein